MNNILPLVGAKSDKGPTRSANEDAYWVSDSSAPRELGALYLVADGVGGQEHGAAAAQQAVQVISAAFYHLRQSGATIPEALNDSILQANQAIFERAQANNISRMGCTLVAAVQHESKLYVAHVGDARAYLLLENRLRPLTRDDTWVQKQVDAGIITAEEAENHELRNIVTQVLGNKLDIVVHQSKTQELRAGDIFLLCSDGLHGVVNNQSLYELMRNNPPQAAAEALVQAAIEAQTKDNVTAVVVNSGMQQARKEKLPAPAKAESDRQTLPLWAIVTIATAVFLVVGYFLYNSWSSRRDAVPAGSGNGIESQGEMGATDTAVPALLEVTQPPAATELILQTATLPPPTESLATAVPPTVTLLPTFTPPPLVGCVTSDGFVWRDEQVYSNSCTHVAPEGRVLRRGDIVRILDPNPQQFNGPDEQCDTNFFLNVQSVDQPNLVGWVLEFSVEPLQPGESCLP